MGHERLHFEAVVNSTEDFIITHDSDGTIKSWNPGAAGIYGFASNEAIGRHFTLLNRPQDKQSSLDKVRRAGSGGHIDLYEEVRVRKDGRLIDVSVQISPVRDENNVIIAVSTISRDVSLRKKLEKELSDAKKALEEHASKLELTVAERTAIVQQRTKQLESFSYTIAHDLRAPLRTISGFAALMQEDSESAYSAAAKDFLARIIKAAKRLDGLIVDLLEYNRVAHGAVGPASVDLTLAVEAALDFLKEVIEKQDAEVTVQPCMAGVRGDWPTLQHALLNLISNALKFARPGVKSVIEIGQEEINGRIRLWVKYNGIGIATEHQEQIFNMFERLHDHHEFTGNGVGLAIVSAAVDRLGGTKGVQSVPNEGSTFWIELPKLQSALHAKAKGDPSPLRRSARPASKRGTSGVTAKKF